MKRLIIILFSLVSVAKAQVNAHNTPGFKNNNPRWYNVEQYGAKHDVQVVTDGAMSSGTAIVVSSNATFVAGDVGKNLYIKKVGAGGADTLATITGFTDSHHVTINKNASTSASGCIVRWGHDDTAPIQAALLACFNGGGGKVYLPNGFYGVFSPLATTDNFGADPNSQIWFPSQNFEEFSDTVQLVVSLVGESRSNQPFSALDNDSSQLENKGVILFSGYTSNDGLGSVIGQAGPFGSGFGTFSGMEVEVENIFVMVADGLNGVHRGAFDFENSVGEHVKNCIAKSDVPYRQTHAPTNGQTYGFFFTHTLGGTNIIQEGVNIAGGFYNGFVISEHVTAANLQAEACYNGFYFNQSSHMSIFTEIKTLWCANGIAANPSISAAFTQIYNMDVEGLDTGTFWYNYRYAINDSLNLITGTCGYWFINSSESSPTTFFTTNGGLHLSAWVLGDPSKKPVSLFGDSALINTALPSSSTGMQQTAVAGIELYTGTAIGAGSPSGYAQFALSSKQQDANNPIARTAWLNRNLGSADQRVAQMDVYTGSATNTGDVRFYTWNAGTQKTVWHTNGLTFDFTAVPNVLNFQTVQPSIQFGPSAASQDLDQGDFFFGENLTYSGGYKFINNGWGSQLYFFNSGGHPTIVMQTSSASGTAGAAATLKVPVVVVGNSTGGTISLGGNITDYTGVGTGGTVNIDNTNIYPVTNLTPDLGKSTQAWRDVYFSHTISESTMGSSNSLGSNVSSATASGSDEDFQLTIVTSGAVAGTIADMTFGRTWIARPHCTISSANAATGSAVAVTVGGYIAGNATSTSNWEMSGAITAAGTYVVNCHCGE